MASISVCCQMLKVFCNLIVFIDYFSKWSEAKPTKDHTAATVGQFLYELICRHGCFRIQINDHGREFVNKLSADLHAKTAVEQRITSSCHPQSNGLCERQNRTIKNNLIKVCEENPLNWPYIVDGILFAHRASRHSSTKFSPFYLLYNREPILFDVFYCLFIDKMLSLILLSAINLLVSIISVFSSIRSLSFFCTITICSFKAFSFSLKKWMYLKIVLLFTVHCFS